VSEAAENLLGRIVALGEEYPERWVPDDVLWPAANLSYDDYLNAAAELVESGLAESQADASEFTFLRATPEGRERVRPL
jgi:hypothetical protein